MKTTQLNKIMIPIIFIGVLGYFGYALFIKAPNPAVIDPNALVEMTSSADSNVLALIEKLRSATIDQTIFSSESFKSLKDFSIVFSPELQGRPNPFAPIGSDGGVTTEQTAVVGTNTKDVSKTGLTTR